MRRVPINRALLVAIVGAMVVGLVPAGVALDRQLERALLDRGRQDLRVAPRILEDRARTTSDALMMHAKELAHVEGLGAAVHRGDRLATMALLEGARPSLGAGQPVVATATGWSIGPVPGSELLEATRRGEMPVQLVRDDGALRTIALAPLQHEGVWIGAAGVTIPLDAGEATGLKGLTRADVIITEGTGTLVTASTLGEEISSGIAAALDRRHGQVDAEVVVGGQRFLAIRAPLGTAGWVIFVRAVADELAVLPALRQTAAAVVGGAALVTIMLGMLLARRVSRPVRQLAAAVTAVERERFDAPLPTSRITEVAQVAERFDEMRGALRQRLFELRQANDTLQDRNARLGALQADLIQRERLAVAGRLVAQLAHEVRNPIASLRNCLELVRRRVGHDPEALEFTDIAIDELLRMHELAEQMLDMSRPRAGAPTECAPMAVAQDVTRLVTAGIPAGEFRVDLEGAPVHRAAIGPDGLKQVLLNLLHNAREAGGTAVHLLVEEVDDGIRLTLRDNGPGIPDALRERVFDPFFSTKDEMRGVGLGLFVAEGLVRSAGGTLRLVPGTAGATFRILLPAVGQAVAPEGAMA